MLRHESTVLRRQMAIRDFARCDQSVLAALSIVLPSCNGRCSSSNQSAR